jgi:16S rRNA C1402 (ribose-2'-O) methylase RsmI
VAEVAARFAEPPKGEITLVIGHGSGAGREAAPTVAAEAVAELVAAGVGRRRAAAIVGRLTGLPRKRLYDLSV